MKKRRKIACLLSMLLICVMVITSISSVYAKDKEDTKAVYPLTIAECEGGKIQVKGQKEQTEYYFSAGDQIELEIQAENGYVIKEIQTDDIKEKIDVSNASEIKIFMASHSVHLIPIFEKISNEESKENSQETGDMDQEPPKDLEADEKREQQMKQILKEIGVGFAEQSDTATFQLSRVAGERINTGAIKTNIGKIDVVDYNGSQWKFLLTWQEGKLGNINTGEGLYCTNPTISFQPGIKTGVDASTIYNKATIQAIVGMMYYYDHFMCKSISDDYAYLFKQCAVWWVLNEVNGWYASGVRVETGNNVKCACGTWLSGHMQDYQVAAFAWVKDNYKYFTNAAGTVYQGNGQPLSKWSGDYTPLGYVKLKKSSANSVVTTGNSCYSIERAEFGVYNNASASDNSKVGTLKTNANGESNILTLNAGTYYVKELKAPKGYALDAQIKKITVASGTTTTVSFADQPQMDTIDVLVRKVDADTDKSKPQGNATLKGAEFTVKFYDGNYKADPADAGKNPLRTWVFKTDQDGMCKYDTKYQVSGDDLYMTSKGNAAMPLGTITIQETKAPEGYLINSKIYVEQITSKGTPESVDTYNQPNVPDNVLKLELVKRQEGAEITIPEAVFEHTEPNGNTEKLTTDQNGKLTIKGLTYGVHKLKEISVMDGYVVNGNSVEFRVETDNKITLISKTDETLGKITFTVTEQGTVSMIVEDKLAPFQIQVHKENEKGLVLENAEFTLYSDKECTKEVAKLKTDEKGVVTFADLKVGQKYYLKETKAPQGYRIPVDGNGNPYFYEVEVTSNPVNDEFKIFINGREVDSSDGIFTLTGTKADRIVSMKVINMTGKKLPETGSNQMLFFIFAAFVAGIITVMMKKRKL